jgi:serine/threonine-protein kinase
VQRSVLGGRYELGAALGSGGFGTVFRARDRRTGADVAVKLVLPGLGSEPAAQRLRREGTILRRVLSRQVARVYDTGDDENGVWLVTELVEGGPLSVETLGRALLPHEVLRVARCLLEGLSAVHVAGIIHGDIKPSNVLTPPGDKALDALKIVDFGLARIMARAEVAAVLGSGGAPEGTVLGTARYMAPELLAGGEPTGRSDLYAAGLLLFELLDDGPVFPVGDLRAQLQARLSGDPYLEERVPEPLSDVFAKLLARDPAARYRDGAAAHQAVSDLDTAPVQITKSDETALAPRVRVSLPPQAPSVPPLPSLPSALAPTEETSAAESLSAATMAPSRRPPPAQVSIVRMTSLPGDAVVALRETLRHLDLPMLDALARRERGNAIGRIARAVALALRLEVDAAALILEPLAMQSDVARAIGAAVLAPRA